MLYLPSQLVHAWKRWFQILEDATHGRNISRRVTPEQYEQWHHQLMALCNKYGVAPSSKSAIIARQMGEIAEPWGQLKTVLEADPDVLLRAVCIATETLHKRVKRRLFRMTPTGALKILLTFGAISLIAICFYDLSIITSIPHEIRGIFKSMERFAHRDRRSFYSVTILLVILGGMIMYSTKKS